MNRPELLSKYSSLENNRLKLMADLAPIDDHILSYKPSSDKWSIVQILFHLHSAEARSIGYVKKKMQAGESLNKTGLLAAARFTYMKWMLRSGVKWKAPAILGGSSGAGALCRGDAIMG
jgi:hypothetical protein